MKRLILSIIIFVSALSGCASGGNSAGSETVKNSETQLSATMAIDESKNTALTGQSGEIQQKRSLLECLKPSDSKEADQLVEKFATGINKGDIELLMTCVDPYDQRKDGLQKAVEYYKVYFNQQSVTGLMSL